MNHKFLFCTLATGVALGLSSSAQAAKHHKVAEAELTDATFALKASDGGMTEVEAGKLAQENGESQDVKDFGAKMVADHGKANDALKAIAEKDKLTLADKPGKMHQEMLDKLGKEKGAEFDKDYFHHMLLAHRMDAALFDKEAANGKNPDLKQFAADTVTVVKSHLSMLEGMKGMADMDKNKHHAKKYDSATSGESKSGVGPGATGEGAKTDQVGNTGGADMGSATNPGASQAADSKGGVGPGSTGNPVPASTPQ